MPEPCSICEGRGWLGFDAPIDHKDFGVIIPCPRCQGQPADYREPDRSLPFMDPPSNLYSDYPRPAPERMETDRERAELLEEIRQARQLLERLDTEIARQIATRPQPAPGGKTIKEAQRPSPAIKPRFTRKPRIN